MPFLFKLSRRLARLRAYYYMSLAVAAVAACEAGDSSLNGPSHPSFATSTGMPAGIADLAVTAVTDFPSRK
jgi:hypothetical protein